MEQLPKPGAPPAEDVADEFFATESQTDTVTKYILHIKSTVNDEPVIGDEPVPAVRKPWQWVTRYRLEEIPKSEWESDEVDRIRRKQLTAFNRTASSGFIEHLRRISKYGKK